MWTESSRREEGRGRRKEGEGGGGGEEEDVGREGKEEEREEGGRKRHNPFSKKILTSLPKFAPQKFRAVSFCMSVSTFNFCLSLSCSLLILSTIFN